MDNRLCVFILFFLFLSCSNSTSNLFKGFYDIEITEHEKYYDLICNSRIIYRVDNEIHMPVKYEVRLPAGLKYAHYYHHRYSFFYPGKEFVGICTDTWNSIPFITSGELTSQSSLDLFDTMFSPYVAKKYHLPSPNNKRRNYVHIVNDSSLILLLNIKDNNFEKYKRQIIHSYRVLPLLPSDKGPKYQEVHGLYVFKIDSLKNNINAENSKAYIIYAKDNFNKQYKILSEESTKSKGKNIAIGDTYDLSLSPSILISDKRGRKKEYYILFHGNKIPYDKSFIYCHSNSLNGLYITNLAK